MRWIKRTKKVKTLKALMETNSLKHVRKETKQRLVKILTTNVNGLEKKVDNLIDTIRRENIDITLI